MRPEPLSCVPLPGERLSVLLPRPGSDMAWVLGKRCANRLSAFLLLGAGWVGAGGLPQFVSAARAPCAQPRGADGVGLRPACPAVGGSNSHRFWAGGAGGALRGQRGCWESP